MSKRWQIPVTLVLGIALGAVGAAAVGGVARALPEPPYRELKLFAKVLDYVDKNYVEEIDETGIIHGAVDGMMDTLDPHSVFMPPDVYAEMKKDTSGEFGGIGIEVTERDGIVTVVSPIPGTPAEHAGIRAGDRIVRIGKETTKGMSVLDAARQMRGAPGTEVFLTLERGDPATTREVKIVRARIRVVPVESRMLEPGYAHVRIKAFQKNTARSLVSHLDRLERQAEGGLAGLILDLRNNPGGLLEQAVKVADEFLDEGLIVSTRGRNRRHAEEYQAHPGGRTRVPLVVLVNHGSASASEIVAGAFQDHGRAVLVGSRSFGKGSVQTVVDLPDGSGLKLTIARYYTPLHRSIHGTGILPDIQVPDEPAATEDPPAAPSSDAEAKHDGAAPKLDDDPQLKSALDHLRALRIFRRQAR